MHNMVSRAGPTTGGDPLIDAIQRLSVQRVEALLDQEDAVTRAKPGRKRSPLVEATHVWLALLEHAFRDEVADSLEKITAILHLLRLKYAS